jgi:hypothetical protein
MTVIGARSIYAELVIVLVPANKALVLIGGALCARASCILENQMFLHLSFLLYP